MTTPAKPGHVWVVEPTGYDEYGIHSIHASLEGAMDEIHPGKPWKWRFDRDGYYDSPADRWYGAGGYYHIYEEEVRP